MPQPLVSLITPFWNTARYADRCIQSLLGQTLNNIEFIFVNDGSPDNCLEIIQGYAKNDSRITVIDKTNGGLSSARNAGMQAARGEYIAFVDSDDWVEPDMYNKLATAAESVSPFYDAVLCGFWRDSPHKNKPYPLVDANTHEKSAAFYFAQKRVRTVWHGIYKRDFLTEHHIRFEETIRGAHEDELFNFDFFAHNPRVAAVPECFYHYVQHEGSEMHRFQEHRLDTANCFAKMAHEHLADIPNCPEPIKKELIRRISSSYFGVLLNEYGVGTPYSARARRERLREITQRSEFQNRVNEARPAGQLDLKRTLTFFAAKHQYIFLLDCLCRAAFYRLSKY